MAREYFPAYHSYLEAMEELNDAERGRLFTACLRYSRTGRPPELTGNERFVFPAFRSQIDRDARKYDDLSRAQTEKANKRWDAAACRGIPGTSGRTGNAKEKETEKTKAIPPPEAPGGGESEAFAQFWAAYPKKVGKQAAWKAFCRAAAPVETLLAAIDRQKRSGQWSRDEGQYIPNPATWLNQGRWEDELPAAGTDGAQIGCLEQEAVRRLLEDRHAH